MRRGADCGEHAGAIVWTVYTYDGIGRTVSVQQQIGSTVSNTSTTSYSGNQTTVTDPAGKWKTFTIDVEGNLVTVTEPDPCVTSNALTTTYTYDWMKHVSGVTMTRPNVSYSGTTLFGAGRLDDADAVVCL